MSDRKTPLTSTVLFVSDRTHAWRAPAIWRLTTRYETPTTVACEPVPNATDYTLKPTAGRSVLVKQQSHVYPVRDDATWAQIEAAHASYQAGLDALAAGLRELGSYASRLEAAGGLKQAPNPLCPTVVQCDDPDEDGSRHYYYGHPVPLVRRKPITRHTPKMLSADELGGYVFSQNDTFVCPDDAAWARLYALYEDATDRATAWQQLLSDELLLYVLAEHSAKYPRPAAAVAPTRRGADALAPTEAAQLVELEAVIARGVQTFIEVGEALAAIREARLYRATHTTFEAYCQERWGIGRGRAYQLISAAETATEMSTRVDIAGATEKAIRPLTTLPPEDAADVYRAAREAAGGKAPTAAQVSAAAAERRPAPEPHVIAPPAWSAQLRPPELEPELELGPEPAAIAVRAPVPADVDEVDEAEPPAPAWELAAEQALAQLTELRGMLSYPLTQTEGRKHATRLLAALVAGGVVRRETVIAELDAAIDAVPVDAAPADPLAELAAELAGIAAALDELPVSTDASFLQDQLDALYTDLVELVGDVDHHPLTTRILELTEQIEARV